MSAATRCTMSMCDADRPPTSTTVRTGVIRTPGGGKMKKYQKSRAISELRYESPSWQTLTCSHRMNQSTEVRNHAATSPPRGLCELLRPSSSPPLPQGSSSSTATATAAADDDDHNPLTQNSLPLRSRPLLTPVLSFPSSVCIDLSRWREFEAIITYATHILSPNLDRRTHCGTPG